MGKYWNRACTGIRWKRRFRAVPTTEIRAFLGVFVESFAYNPKRICCFSPNDKINDIYRTEYPSNFVPDFLELETLSIAIEESYGIQLETLWSTELTLGDLFEACYKRQI